MRSATAALFLACVACSAIGHEPESGPYGYEQVYAQDFASASALDEFTFTDPDSWAHWIATDDAREGTVGALDLIGASRYGPPHRSPHSIALLKDLIVGDFVLEVDVMQTGREYGHRDSCIFFGFQGTAQYYYVHLATTPDQNAGNVFLVSDAPRRNLAPVSTKGVDWGQEVWHHVRLERTLADGAIRVYFDDMDEPVLLATDVTYPWGRVGLGSFDDTGRFTNLRVWAPDRREPDGVEAIFPVPARSGAGSQSLLNAANSDWRSALARTPSYRRTR